MNLLRSSVSRRSFSTFLGKKINGRRVRYDLESNGREWGLMELDFRIREALEENFDGASLQIPVIDIIAPEIPGAILGNHAIQVLRRMGLFCPEIRWAPRFTTVQSQDHTVPNVPLTEAEKQLKMPERVFSRESSTGYFYSQVHSVFSLEAEIFWEESTNLIRHPKAVTLSVLSLLHGYPTIYGEQSAGILDDALSRVTEGQKRISLIDWVPSSLVVAKL